MNIYNIFQYQIYQVCGILRFSSIAGRKLGCPVRRVILRWLLEFRIFHWTQSFDTPCDSPIGLMRPHTTRYETHFLLLIGGVLLSHLEHVRNRRVLYCQPGPLAAQSTRPVYTYITTRTNRSGTMTWRKISKFKALVLTAFLQHIQSTSQIMATLPNSLKVRVHALVLVTRKGATKALVPEIQVWLKGDIEGTKGMRSHTYKSRHHC